MAKPRKQFMRKLTTWMDTDNGKLADGIKFIFKDALETTREWKLCDFPESILAEAAAHGLKQKVGDKVTDQADNASEAVVISAEMVYRLMAGNWNLEKGGSGISDTWILAAVAQEKELPLEKVQAVFEGLSDDGKKAVRERDVTRRLAEKLRAESMLDKARDAESDDESGDPLDAFA